MEIIKCRTNYGGAVEVRKDKFSFRPSVYGIVIKAGKILVMTIKSTGRLWLPGGGVNLCEKVSDALIREMKEETGLQVTNIGDLILATDNLMYCNNEDSAFHNISHFYRCDIKDSIVYELRPDDDDPNAENLRWLSLEEVKEIGFHDQHEELINALERNFNK